MPLSKELDYRLRYLDFDRYGRIQPTAVLDLLQDVATVHAEEIGIGRDAMVARGVFWAVVRLKYEIVRDPKYFSVVRVRTWPHTLTNFSFLRDFSICDENGELLRKASSEWVLMDVETRKFVRAKNYYEGPLDFDEARSFEGKMRKIADFDEGNCELYTVVPAYSDIDVNGHVNNARYPHFAIDALNPSKDGAVKTFQIDYRHEVLPDVPLVVHTLNENGLVRTKGVREDGFTAFACAIELR